MIGAILSGDLPRSRVLSVVLVLIGATLALAPFLFSGAQAINTAAKICVFIVLVASYDLLLGYAGIGGEVIVLVFIVIIIGGLGSVGGCFLGSILVAQMANYTGYLAPKVALASNILLMVIVLMWRPQGLYPVAKR